MIFLLVSSFGAGAKAGVDEVDLGVQSAPYSLRSVMTQFNEQLNLERASHQEAIAMLSAKLEEMQHEIAVLRALHQYASPPSPPWRPAASSRGSRPEKAEADEAAAHGR